MTTKVKKMKVSSTSMAFLGLDFGTESVRALMVGPFGEEIASAVAVYPHGQILEHLPGKNGPQARLPPDFALQHPMDWLDSAAKATRAAVRKAKIPAAAVAGIGVDFTSCTMLPCKKDGTPLCLLEPFVAEPLAWPKLWKHHGAKKATAKINRIARERDETFLKRYGGIIGLEWFFPKILETLEEAPAIYRETEVWIEAGDWLVWRLVGGPAESLPRSTCQAGYKGMWNAIDGYPHESFLRAVHPKLGNVVKEKIPGRLIPPGVAAGELIAPMAQMLGLTEGTPVSAAIIDAHAGVPGAGAAAPGTLVMVMGTSACHMLNSTSEEFVPGVAGVVKDGILPGYYGYETGQAAVGDAFDWLRRLVGAKNLDLLGQAAAELPPSAGGITCVDWFNGCRTPLMDGSLTGSLAGLKLHHGAAELYRAILEGSAFGLRWIVELLREGGVPVKKFVATGGLPHHNPLMMQVYADVLGETILVHPCKHGSALGAAILGALAAGYHSSPGAAIRAMSPPLGTLQASSESGSTFAFRPQRAWRKIYDQLYREYRRQGSFFATKS
jgi:L-ribulokinase